MAKMNQEQAARNENQKVTAWNQYKQQNGYGVQPSADGRGTIPGEKEMPGVNSYAEGVKKLSEMYGVPPEAFGKDAANAVYEDGVGGSGGFGGSGYGGTQSGVDQDLLENTQTHLILRVLNLKTFLRQKSRALQKAFISAIWWSSW